MTLSDEVNNSIDSVLDRMESLQVGANSDWFWQYAKTRKNTFSEQARRWSAILPAPSPGAKIIDFGAAPFVVCEVLAMQGYSVTAVDLNPYRFENVDKLFCKIHQGDIEKPETISSLENFDVAIFSHVFEHLRIDLLGTLCAVHDSLKPGGKLILETPNLLSARGWSNLLRKGVAYSCAGSISHEWSKLEHFGHMGHVREYSAQELRELLESTGFEIEEMYFSGLWKAARRKWKAYLPRTLQRINPSLRQNITIIAIKRVSDEKMPQGMISC